MPRDLSAAKHNMSITLNGAIFVWPSCRSQAAAAAAFLNIWSLFNLGGEGLDLLLSLVNSTLVLKLILQQYAWTNRLVQIYALETLVGDSQPVVELPVSLSARVVGLQSANN